MTIWTAWPMPVLGQDGGLVLRGHDQSSYHIVIHDLFTGQYDMPVRVVAFDPAEGWSGDASDDAVKELAQPVIDEEHEITEAVREFIERFTGEQMAAQLILPLRKF
jgi:hypothetical protein